MRELEVCRGDGCDKKDTCYRFKVKRSKFSQTAIAPDPETCKHYIECNSKSQMRRLDVVANGQNIFKRL